MLTFQPAVSHEPWPEAWKGQFVTLVVSVITFQPQNVHDGCLHVQHCGLAFKGSLDAYVLTQPFCPLGLL